MKRFGKKFRRFAAAIGLALVVDLALPLIAESTTPFVVKFIGSLIGDLFKKDTPPYEPNVNSPVPSDGESRKLAQDPDSCFALFIGVDAYDSLPNLSYSSSDAKALRDAVLKLGFRNENVWLCVSDGSRRELPTKKNVDAALADMLAAAEEAGDDATIFISLSGHGFETPEGAAAFCPKDAVAAVSPGKPTTVTRESAVLVDDLMKKLREHRARFKMLIVDACRSPAQMKGNDAYERSFRIDNVPSGIAFLQSCGSGEASYEDAEFRRSVFTHYFIEGLEGKAENKDGGVTFFDLCGYAAQKTQARVETTYKGKQTPVFNISGVNFVLKESTRSAADALYREGRALAWGLDGTKIDGFRALDLLSQAAEAGLTDAQAALAQLYYDGCEATPPDFKKAVEWANRAGENPIAQNVLGDCFLDGLAVSKDEAEAKRLHEAAFKRFQELAESGDPIILNLLARCYYYGRGTKLDFIEATKYFRLAAERCALGVANLGYMYYNGCGVESDYAEAIRLSNDAIELNCSFAYGNLAYCYRDGKGVPQDYEKANELYRQAAEKNVADGVLCLGIAYENGLGVERNPKEAVRLYRQASEWNNANAMEWLGHCYADGVGVEQDRFRAFELWSRAAEQNAVGALAAVAMCYENGWGTAKNEEIAKQWRAREFQKCSENAEASMPGAMNWLGDYYYYGSAGEPDYDEATRWYRKAAEKGEETAIGCLGVCYYNGQGVEQNYEEAIKYFRRADERGWLYAKYWLGECYYYGKGVEQNYEEAVRLYRAAAEKNVADAMNALGMCYANGNGVEQDYVEASNWRRRAADLNHIWGLADLANCYYNGKGVSQDYEKAVELYRRAADLGNIEATYRLGLCYWNGKGVAQDYATAIQYFRDAAESEHAVACCELGNCYYYGNGAKQNYEEAVNWYRKGAELKNAESITRLGGCYYDGRGVEKDPTEAARLYREAAEAGYADAMNRLGVCYGDGVGVEKNEEEARRWHEKAAELGVAQAAANLAYMCFGQDKAEALRWNCRAAELGHSDAAFIAGTAYLLGQGVEPDLRETLKYWRRAAELGNRHALGCLGQAAIYEELAKNEQKFGVSLGIVVENNWMQDFNAALKETGDVIFCEEGIAYLEQAEKLEDTYARVWLGMCRFYGVGLERDLDEAKRLFRLAATSDAPGDEPWIECAETALENWSEKVAKLNAALEAENAEEKPFVNAGETEEDPFADTGETEEAPFAEADKFEAQESPEE